MDKTNEELKALIKLAQGNRGQNQFAAHCQLNSSALTYYLNGKRRPTPEMLKKISLKAYNNVTYEMLMKAAGYPDYNIVPYQFDRDTIKIKVYGKIAAGEPIEMCEDIVAEEEIPAAWLKGGAKYFGLKISGDSMLPEFKDGDTVIFKQQHSCESGQYCAVSINCTECTFKKVIRRSDGITLQPLNSAYEPVFFTTKQINDLPITILGVIVENRRKY